MAREDPTASPSGREWDEITNRWRERMALRTSDRTLLFLTMVLTVASNLTVAIAVGTGLGLAMRLVRRDVEPAEWTPSDRSRL